MLRATRALRLGMFSKSTTGQGLGSNGWKSVYMPNMSGLALLIFWSWALYKMDLWYQRRESTRVIEERKSQYQAPDPAQFRDCVDYQTGSGVSATSS